MTWRDESIKTMNALDKVLVYAPQNKKKLASMGINPRKMEIIPMTLKHISGLHARKMPSMIKTIKFGTLASCGSVEKGSQLIYDTLAILEKKKGLDYEFHIFGGTDRNFGKFKKVRCRGKFSPKELDNALNEINVGIVPSIWEEIYGFVGIEFISKGIPVIGNNLGGIPDYAGKYGWLNKSNSAEGLARIMEHLIKNPELISKMNRKILKDRSKAIISMEQHWKMLKKIYLKL